MTTTPKLELVSTQDGTTPLSSDNGEPSISDDGNLIAFASKSSSLGVSDPLGYGIEQIFVKNMTTGTITPVSDLKDYAFHFMPRISGLGGLTTYMVGGLGPSRGPEVAGYNHKPFWVVDKGNKTGSADEGSTYTPTSISGDGSLVGFDSTKKDLGPTVTGTFSQVYLHDVASGANTLISKSTSGGSGAGNSWNAYVSEDGRFVAFESFANLGFGVAKDEVYLYNVSTKTLRLVSRATPAANAAVDSGAAADGNNDTGAPVLSANGRYVVFISAATNLGGGSAGLDQIYLRDNKTGKLTLVSSADGVTPANGTCGFGVPEGGYQTPFVSNDGRFVVFASKATNLDQSATSGKYVIYRKDVVKNTITVVSANNGTVLSGDSVCPGMSADGSEVVFQNYPSSGGSEVYRVHFAVPATLLWSKGVNGSFEGDPAVEWQLANKRPSDQTPNGQDDVVLRPFGTKYTVTTNADETVSDLTVGVGATLQIGAGTTFTLDGLLDDTNIVAGNIEIGSNATVNTQGTFKNQGQITLGNGAGLNGTAALTNSDTIDGAGTIGQTLTSGGMHAGSSAADAVMALTNNGSIIADVAGQPLNIDIGGNDIINFGTIAAAAGDLHLQSEVQNKNTGKLLGSAGGGTLFIDANTLNSGQITALPGGKVVIDGLATVTNKNAGAIFATGAAAQVTLTENATVAGGVLKTISGGEIHVHGPAFLDGTTAGITNLGAGFILDDGAQLTLKGAITNNGMMAMNGATSATSLIVSGSVQLNGSGSVALANNANNQIKDGGAAATLTNNGNTISGAGTIGDSSASLLTLLNQGKVIANSPSTALLLATQDVNNAGGVLKAVNGATLTVLGLTVQNTAPGKPRGQIIADGAGSHVDLDGVTIRGGTLTGINKGVINVLTKTDETFDGAAAAVNLVGAVNVSSGGTLDVSGAIKNGGTLDDLGLVRVTSATLQGTGAIVCEATGRISLKDATASLTNESNKISGHVSIDGNGGTLTNGVDGTIIGNLGQMAITGTSLIENEGMLKATHGAQISIVSNVIANQGTIVSVADGVDLALGPVINITDSEIRNLRGKLAVGGVISIAGKATPVEGTLNLTRTKIRGGDLAIGADGLVQADNLDCIGVSITNTGEFDGFDTITIGSITNNGKFVARIDSTVTIFGDVTGKGTMKVVSGATLRMVGNASETVFMRGAGTLQLDHPERFAGVVDLPTDSNGAAIDVVTLPYDADTTRLFVVTDANKDLGILHVKHGSADARIKLHGLFTTDDFQLKADASGKGTLVTYLPPAPSSALPSAALLGQAMAGFGMPGGAASVNLPLAQSSLAGAAELFAAQPVHHG